METAIECVDVSRVYSTATVETRAVSNANLSIARGEYVAITGTSGSGKSTLLAVMGLLEPPSAGRVAIGGEDTANMAERRRCVVRNRQIGFVFQSFDLIDDLTIFANVELPLTYRSGVRRAERRERVEHVLDAVGLRHRSKHYPSQLSGGQQQRAAVARAVVGDPAILLADEPTGNLDSENTERVMGILEDLNSNGITLCFVTHDEALAERAGRRLHMHDGMLQVSV